MSERRSMGTGRHVVLALCALGLVAACSQSPDVELPMPAPPAARPLYFPLFQLQGASGAAAEATKPEARQSVVLHLPLVALGIPLVGEAASAPLATGAQNNLSAGLTPAAQAAERQPATVQTQPVAFVPAQPPALDTSTCKVYPNVRITWYELGSCCDKPPGHPQYGITRSGLPVAWGMAAVQARVPLLPMGTRFIVRDIGPEYVFTVADTGSETAFGSSWIDIYAPTIAVGHWVERQTGDGRSDVLVCGQ